MTAIRSETAAPLAGTSRVPGDKSISHRALIMGALAVGETEITGLLGADDVKATAGALAALGAGIARDSNGETRVRGVGIGGLMEPASVLDLGNSGTGARLLIGVLATHALTAHITGDASLCSRPMGRVIEPLQQMGARFQARSGGRLPLAVTGAEMPVPIDYTLPVPSAQVKSAILLAGLNTPGQTTVIEPSRSRDHTELLFRHFGVPLKIRDDNEGGRAITVTGHAEISGRPIRVPGDPSSAAFAAVAALIVPDSDITLTEIGVNPLRAGLYQTLGEMGANVEFLNVREEAGEPVADLRVRFGRLEGIDVPAERAPAMIDEYPILAVAAAFARGTTRMRGLSELRVKESDRLAAIAAGLAACGTAVRIEDDDLIVEGGDGPVAGGADIVTHHDHRIAMSFLVLGMAARSPVTIDDDRMIATSFPGFAELMNGLGARLTPA